MMDDGAAIDRQCVDKSKRHAEGFAHCPQLRDRHAETRERERERERNRQTDRQTETN